MYEKYLVTGAKDPVGRLVVQMLMAEGCKVRVLMPPESDVSLFLGMGVEVAEGEIFDKDSLKDFLAVEDPRHSAVIHTEEVVSITNEKNLNMRRVNVTGTENLVEMAMRAKIGKFVYMGSAYSLDPDTALSGGEQVHFDRTKVDGDYACTKAEAAAYIMQKVSLNKFNASLLLPTFIIGPGFSEDYDMNRILKKYLENRVSTVSGGHAFVDVRNVATALIGVCENGVAGGAYILNGEYKSSKEFFEEVSETSGSAKVKEASKLVQSKSMAKFVDTFYRITKKDNPKEVYALFMNSPETNYESTVQGILPEEEVRKVHDSLTDVLTRPGNEVLPDRLPPKIEKEVEDKPAASSATSEAETEAADKADAADDVKAEAPEEKTEEKKPVAPVTDNKPPEVAERIAQIKKALKEREEAAAAAAAEYKAEEAAGSKAAGIATAATATEAAATAVAAGTAVADAAEDKKEETSTPRLSIADILAKAEAKREAEKEEAEKEAQKIEEAVEEKTEEVAEEAAVVSEVAEEVEAELDETEAEVEETEKAIEEAAEEAQQETIVIDDKMTDLDLIDNIPEAEPEDMTFKPFEKAEEVAEAVEEKTEEVAETVEEAVGEPAVADTTKPIWERIGSSDLDNIDSLDDLDALDNAETQQLQSEASQIVAQTQQMVQEAEVEATEDIAETKAEAETTADAASDAAVDMTKPLWERISADDITEEEIFGDDNF